jgi:hypothetical protein
MFPLQWARRSFALAAIPRHRNVPNHSTVVDFVGTVDPSTGIITPVAVGYT